MMKQITDANTIAFNNAVNMMVGFQGKTEEIIKTAMDSMPVPEEAKTAVLQVRETGKGMVNKMVDFNKAGYEKISEVFIASQAQTEEMINTAMDSSLVPEEAKKAFRNAMDAYKENFNKTKVVFDENLAKVEGVIRA